MSSKHESEANGAAIPCVKDSLTVAATKAVKVVSPTGYTDSYGPRVVA
jgi:hypothetical protein